MNLFRSEEDVRRWSLYDASASEGTLALEEWVVYFSAPRFQLRLDLDYLVKRAELHPTREEVLAQMGKSGPFWGMPAAPR